MSTPPIHDRYENEPTVHMAMPASTPSEALTPVMVKATPPSLLDRGAPLVVERVPRRPPLPPEQVQLTHWAHALMLGGAALAGFWAGLLGALAIAEWVGIF